jgi:hypothetical protein
MAHSTSSDSTLSPPRRTTEADIEKQPPSSSSTSRRDSDLADHDRPHRQDSQPLSNDVFTSTEEPPLETGSPYRSPNAPTVAPDKVGSYWVPSNPKGSVFSLLVFATIWGVLARLGLLWIGGFGEREVFALVWAQCVGCLVMGVVTERKKGIEKVCVCLPFLSLLQEADEERLAASRHSSSCAERRSVGR